MCQPNWPGTVFLIKNLGVFVSEQLYWIMASVSSVPFLSSPALILLSFRFSPPPRVQRRAGQSTRNRCLHSWVMMSCYSSSIILPRSELCRQWCIKIIGLLEERGLLGHKAIELEVGVELKICWVSPFITKMCPKLLRNWKHSIPIRVFEVI